MKLIVLVVTATLVFSCGPEKKKEQQPDERLAEQQVEPMAAATEAAALTNDQKKNGWKLIFDGKTLDGWRVYLNKENNSWEVKDGMLHCKPFSESGDNKRSDLVTVEEYSSFELSWDWKVAPKSNSGVIYHVTEEFDQPYKSGPEYQMIDDRGADGKLEEWQKTGGVYAMYAPVSAKPKPAGEWNTSRIVVSGNHVEHWLNGTKVLEYELHSPDWKKKKAAGKWKDENGYGMAQKGHADLQDHSSEAWFKNIMLRTL
jgi:Domain of Unknown Function (DUF1080)